MTSIPMPLTKPVIKPAVKQPNKDIATKSKSFKEKLRIINIKMVNKTIIRVKSIDKSMILVFLLI